jgi:hypothetical protein
MTIVQFFELNELKMMKMQILKHLMLQNIMLELLNEWLIKVVLGKNGLSELCEVM